MKESDFQSKGMFQGFSPRLFNVYATKQFFFKTSLDGYWQSYGSRVQISSKKCSEIFIEYFTHSKNEMVECVNSKIF